MAEEDAKLAAISKEKLASLELFDPLVPVGRVHLDPLFRLDVHPAAKNLTTGEDLVKTAYNWPGN